MSKGSKNRRKKLKEDLKKKRIDGMQSTFVDANVFLDAILKESSRGLSYFGSSFRGKNQKAITSTHAIGEIVKRLYLLAREEKGMADSEYKVNNHIMAFKRLLDTCNIEIMNFSDKTFELIEQVNAVDNRLKFKDAIHVALAYENLCKKFATLDKGIDEGTLKKFNIVYADV